MRLASIYVATDSAMADAEDLTNDVKSLQLNGTDDNGAINKVQEYADQWGFPLSALYKLALKFYKGMHSVRHRNEKVLAYPFTGSSVSC